MESYNNFAYIYDKLIDQNYDEWVLYIEEIFKRYNLKPQLVLDLGCGTGSIAVKMAQRGYEMLGIDLSEDMLLVASEKAAEANADIRFICQDISEFELYGTVDAIYCTLDVINYITDLRAFKRVFALVGNYLNPGGLFIFDVNTRYKLEKVLGNNTFVYEQDNVFYTWESEFDKKRGINISYLNFFVGENDSYKRFDEEHIQRAYDDKVIKEAAERAGLKYLDSFKNLTFEKPGKNCEKVMYILKK